MSTIREQVEALDRYLWVDETDDGADGEVHDCVRLNEVLALLDSQPQASPIIPDAVRQACEGRIHELTAYTPFEWQAEVAEIRAFLASSPTMPTREQIADVLAFGPQLEKVVHGDSYWLQQADAVLSLLRGKEAR